MNILVSTIANRPQFLLVASHRPVRALGPMPDPDELAGGIKRTASKQAP